MGTAVTDLPLQGDRVGGSQRLRKATDDDRASQPGERPVDRTRQITASESREGGKPSNHLSFPASCRDSDPYVGA